MRQPLIEAPFIKGLQLSEIFYDEAVKPILTTHFPQLDSSVGRLGYGSGVLSNPNQFDQLKSIYGEGAQ